MMFRLPGRPRLDPDSLLQAYRHGVFPMHDGRAVRWFCADPRGILPLGPEFHVPRRLATAMRRPKEAGRYRTTCDHAFEQVIRCCAERPHDDGTWISPEIIDAYCGLHRAGCAHSIEVWDGGQLAGGLYGVAIGSAFFGESIMTRLPEGGKVALVELVRRLRLGGFVLLDIQMVTNLTAAFGAHEIPFDEYRERLAAALEKQPYSGSWNRSAGVTSPDGSVSDSDSPGSAAPESGLFSR